VVLPARDPIYLPAATKRFNRQGFRVAISRQGQHRLGEIAGIRAIAAWRIRRRANDVPLRPFAAPLSVS
jgi:hypothetical protein